MWIVYHVLIIKKYEEEVNGLIRGILERQPTKKRFNVLSNAIFHFFVVKDLFKKDHEQQKGFLQDLDLLNVKNQLPLQFVKNVSLNVLFYICVLKLCSLPKRNFL
jgi:hypothetical protein